MVKLEIAGEGRAVHVKSEDGAIEIRLRDDRFDTLVVEVADPGAEVAKVTRALEAS